MHALLLTFSYYYLTDFFIYLNSPLIFVFIMNLFKYILCDILSQKSVSYLKGFSFVGNRK